MSNKVTPVKGSVVPTLRPLTTLKWFEFSQNNSGGNFVVDENVSEFVFVQAASAEDAIEIAEQFCDNGDSCECCGDRWSFYLYGDGRSGYNEPMIYGQPLALFSSSFTKSFSRLHHYDGRVESYPPVSLAIADGVFHDEQRAINDAHAAINKATKQ